MSLPNARLTPTQLKRKRATDKTWRERNRDKMRECNRRWEKEHRDSINKLRRMRGKIQRGMAAYKARQKRGKALGRARLSNEYVKKLICGTSSLTDRDIPQTMVEAKREHLKLKRRLTHENKS